MVVEVVKSLFFNDDAIMSSYAAKKSVLREQSVIRVCVCVRAFMHAYVVVCTLHTVKCYLERISFFMYLLYIIR
jgi:hypothetical protein